MIDAVSVYNALFFSFLAWLILILKNIIEELLIYKMNWLNRHWFNNLIL